MTYLLMQTFLLLLSAYFLGAFVACVIKRWISAGAIDGYAQQPALATQAYQRVNTQPQSQPNPNPNPRQSVAERYPVVERQPAIERAPPQIVRPRVIEPIQPKIDILPRPAPRPVPKIADVSRFDRALWGPELNEGMPRLAVVEIRPAVHKLVTGPALPWPPPKSDAQIASERAAEKAAEQEAKLAADLAARTAAEKTAAAAAAKVTGTEALPPVAALSGAKPPAAKTEVKPVAARAFGMSGALANAAAAAVSAAKAATGTLVAGKTDDRGSVIEPSPDAKSADSVLDKKSSDQSPLSAQKDLLPPPPEPMPPPGAAKPDITTVNATKVDATKPDTTKVDTTTPGAAKPGAAPSSVAKESASAALAKPVAATPVMTMTPATPATTGAVPSVEKPTPRTDVETREDQSKRGEPAAGGDDLQRIRAIDTAVEEGLKSLGVLRFEDIARWTPADINRLNQALGLSGRIDREQWIEQAQILAKGGETYYSRNRAAAAKSAVSTGPATIAKTETAKPEPANIEKAKSDTLKTAAPPPAATNASPASDAKPLPGAVKVSVTPTELATKAQPAAGPVSNPAVGPSASPPTPSPSQPAATTSGASRPVGVQGRSVAELAAAAAAAIAAASASVTRGIRPIEPISPLSKADPNLVMPTKLADAIKDQGAKAAASVTPGDPERAGETRRDATTRTKTSLDNAARDDDLKRIRGIGVLIEKKLAGLGVTRYDQIANWTSGDIDRISQMLDFKGRIERENWVEQARILSSGGHTEFSRRVDRGEVESSRDS